MALTEKEAKARKAEREDTRPARVIVENVREEVYKLPKSGKGDLVRDGRVYRNKRVYEVELESHELWHLRTSKALRIHKVTRISKVKDGGHYIDITGTDWNKSKKKKDEGE